MISYGDKRHEWQHIPKEIWEVDWRIALLVIIPPMYDSCIWWYHSVKVSMVQLILFLYCILCTNSVCSASTIIFNSECTSEIYKCYWPLNCIFRPYIRVADVMDILHLLRPYLTLTFSGQSTDMIVMIVLELSTGKMLLHMEMSLWGRIGPAT